MASAIIYERYLWFHHQTKNGKYPNTKNLSEQFGVSRKTAQRNIEFMRDRLDAPLIYVPEKRGYAYESNKWEIPGLWMSEDELISLVLSCRLATSVPDSSIKAALKKLLNQIIAHHSSATVSIDELSERISVKNIAYTQTNEVIFHALLNALLRSKPVRIEYYSPHSEKTSSRDILPLHLFNYMGTWHIIAQCNVKKELRDFVLSRIKTIDVSSSEIQTDMSAAKIKGYIRQTFGIFRGKKIKTVRLRFSSSIAPWVAELNWHPRQKINTESDGRLRLTIPVADFREIKREILRYGAQCEVISPLALRNEIIEETEKMRRVYR